MNSRLRLYSLVILFSIAGAANLPAAQITIDSDDQFTYACHLMEKQEYGRAAGEFERLIYFFPEDKTVPEARYLIGLCHLKAKDFESARKVCFDLYKDFPDSLVGGKALLLMGETYYLQGAMDEADRYFRMVIERFPESDLQNRALYRQGWARMKVDRFKEASRTFKQIDRKSPLYPSALTLSDKSMEAEALPYKDPVAAGVMAGALPGLGHAYCERYKDGMVALLLNGLFIWAAYESFDNDHEVLGGILSFLELGWYSGNIYSAINCAHKHNRAVRNKYRNDLQDRFDLSLFTNGESELGLALRIDF